TTIACGLMTAIWRLEREATGQRKRADATVGSARALRVVGAMAALVVMGGAWTWALSGAYGAYMGEQLRLAALGTEELMSREDRQPTYEDLIQDFVDLIRSSELALAADPTNVKLAYWLSYYRWQSVSFARDQSTGEMLLHGESLPFVERIADELDGVRRLCPTWGPPYALEGQLRLFVLNDNAGGELIRKGFRLAAYDAPTCWTAGQLAAMEGDYDLAAERLNRSVMLAPSYYREVIDIYLSQLNRPDLAVELAGDDYRRLTLLAQACAASEEHAELAKDVQEKAVDSLRRQAEGNEATAWQLATLAAIDARDGDHEVAVKLYRRALALDFGNVNWRMALARSLAELGSIKEAMREARTCLRFRPEMPAAVRLISDLSVHPDAS
ncbi:MAG: tetratricopeptide repeat protein, partial [Planctomycetota bacterium]